jgi:SAM-dependent methyltransferase
LYIKLFDKKDCTAIPAVSALATTHLVLLLVSFSVWRLLALLLERDTEEWSLLFGLLVSVGLLVCGRVWVFINPKPAVVSYEEISGDFYQDATQPEQVGRFRAFYHEGRYVELQARVQSVYKTGDVIYDFGCGGAEWNRGRLPVVGIDVNRSLLEHGMSKKQLSEIIVTELGNTGLPDSSADIVIMSEVMEHLLEPKPVLREIYRCLKPGGHLILTVPWDTPFSLFFWLFNVQCFYRGYILGEAYYRQRCGHVNHFSAFSLRRLLQREGFSVNTIYRFRGFLLYTISTK